jgi:hypothetical protein
LITNRASHSSTDIRFWDTLLPLRILSHTVTHKEEYYTGESHVVTYNIDRDGLRISAPKGQINGERSILFFGCSFTFGEAVEDEETLPYQLGRLLTYPYSVYNFGFEGYGPNHMLAALEAGLATNIVASPPEFVFYQAIPDHVKRIVGGHPWIKYGPIYHLSASGSVTLVGHFDDSVNVRTPAPDGLVIRQLKKSFLLRALWKGRLLFSRNTS